jgi:hypothetical protein
MIIYFLIVVAGSLIAGKLILGELRKERRDYVVLVQPSTAAEFSPETKPSVKPAEFISPAVYTPFVKVERQGPQSENWETILQFKNSEIAKLTKDLEAQKYQTQEFEKIKALLERQIFESRQMNRAVKKELDALVAQGQKTQDEITKLQVELNYKNQLLNQTEVKMTELKNRISKILPNTDASVPTQPESGPVQKPELDLGDFSFDQLDWRNKLTE